MFLNSATPPDSAGHTNPVGLKTRVQPELTSLPSSSFVTSSDLEAFERRFQVLVSEATASINSQLCARTSTQAHVPSQTTSFVSPANKSSKPTPQQGSSTGRPMRNPGRIQQRERLMAATGGTATGESAPAEEAGAAERPKPRLQLNVQMFRKQPIFKFFVTAPVDSDNNPHKWRCRVCHVELSLKTKGSLEILSDYRTEAHLVREHRIRMETPGLLLFGKDEQELIGLALDEASEKAGLEFPIAPILGECYILPGQQELPPDTDALDPSSTICSKSASY